MSLSYKDFLRSLIYILEAKKLHYPRFIYCLMIVIMYSQFAGYVFCTYATKPLLDPKIIFVAHWNEYSPGTFLLFVAGIDSLTLITFWIFEAMLYAYFLYIIVLTLINYYRPTLTKIYADFFGILNTFYQFFFSSFLWVFYVPFTEIHSGIIVCGSNSFLVEYRNKDCSTKPIYFYILGTMGLLLTFFTGVVLVYFYVNYEFLDKNYLKRRFQPNQILQLLARTLLIFFYYLDMSNILLVKHIVSHILGLMSCYDFVFYLPFRDRFICTFYGCVTFIYEYAMVLFSFWELTTFLEEFNIFFIWIIGANFLTAFVIIYVNNYYHSATLLLPGSLNKSNIVKVDIMLEELIILTENSQWNKASKTQLQGIIERLIKKIPSKINFFLKKTDLQHILEDNMQINMGKIVTVVDQLFGLFLRDSVIMASQDIYEYISLKYCSFLGIFQENPIKAYFELKTLLSMNKQNNVFGVSKKQKYQSSIIFLIVSEVISNQIQNLLINTFKIKYEMSIMLNDKENNLQDTNSDIIWKSLPQSEEYKLKYVKEMSKLVKFKLKLWESLCMGYHRMDDFLKDSLILMRRMEEFSNDFYSNINENKLQNIELNPIYLKLMSLFSLMILNDRIKAKSFEEKLKELKKNDMASKENCANSLTILSGNSIVIQISLLHEKGKIMSQKTERIASFFGYNSKDFQSIFSINSLMPELISNNHSMFLNRFIKYGPSTQFLKGKQVYAKTAQGFIFPIKMNLNLRFVMSEDFIISGVLTKFNRSSLTFMFNKTGNILGVSQALGDEIGNEISKSELLQIYQNYKIFWFIPELIEQLPSPEDINSAISKKECVFDAIINGRASIYFPKDLKISFEMLKKYRQKFEQNINSIKKYEDLFIKESKVCMKKFCYLSSFKTNLIKKLARYSLRHELYFLSSKRYLSIFILNINELYQIDNQNDLDFLSYSIDKTNTTQNSQFTILTMQSKKSEKNENSSKELQEIPQNPVENLQNPEITNNLLNLQNQNEILAINTAELNKIKEEENKIKENIDDKSDKKSEKLGKISQSFEDQESDEEIKNNDVRESSVKTGKSSQFSSKGQGFIASFIKNGKIGALLRKIFLILILQILVFFLIDIIYIILIKSKFDEYLTSLQESTNPTYIFNFYCKSLLSASSYAFYRNGILNESDIISSSQLLNDLVKTSYNGFKSMISDDSLIVNEIYQEKILIKMIDNDFTSTFSLQNITFATFTQELKTIINSLVYKNDNYLYYLKMHVNFLSFYNEIENIMSKILLQLDDSKTSFTAFYIYLTISGIVASLLLQFISYPFYKKYYKYFEKILILVSRVQEKECDHELYKLKRFLFYLEDSDESFLVSSCSKMEGEKHFFNLSARKNDKSEKIQTENYREKAKKSKKSNYLTSRIVSHQLNMRNFKIIFFISIAFVTGYYGGAFLFLLQINNYLEYSNKTVEFATDFYTKLNVNNLAKLILIASPYMNEETVLGDDEIRNIKEIFNSSLYDLQKNFDNKIEISNNEIPQEYLNRIDNILNDNSCDFPLNFEDCSKLTFNNFKFGLREYLNDLVNKMTLIQNEILNPENLTLYQVKQIICEEESLLESISRYRVMEKTLNMLENEALIAAENIINVLYNNLFLLFVWGGVLCSLLWFLMVVLRMKIMWSEVYLSKKLLILIPTAKLNEETTLHLMKNLDNI